MNQHNWQHALGPLLVLWEDSNITEIMVDAPDRVYITHNGKREDSTLSFESAEAMQTVILHLLALGGVNLNPEQTMASIRLPDGSHMTAVLPPTAVNGPCFMIRRFVENSLTWEQLLSFGSLSEEALQCIKSALSVRINILLAGGTNSGKTTVANLITESIPADQRIIVVEHSYQMRVKHPRLLFFEAGVSPLTDILDIAEYMAPDWVVINDLHGPEAFRALQVLSTGHNGILITHANDTEDALMRIESMCLMANMGLGVGDIRTLIASAVQLIIYQQYLPNGKRCLTALSELQGLEHGRFVLQPLFRYDQSQERLVATTARPRWS